MKFLWCFFILVGLVSCGPFSKLNSSEKDEVSQGQLDSDLEIEDKLQFELVFSPDVLEGFELGDQKPTLEGLDELTKSDLITITFSQGELQKYPEFQGLASEDGLVRIVTTTDGIEFFPKESLVENTSLQLVGNNKNSIKRKKASTAQNERNIIKSQDGSGRDSIEYFSRANEPKKLKNKNPDYSNYQLRYKDVVKKNVVENDIASVLKQPFELFRFTEKNVAKSQVAEGSFSKTDEDFLFKNQSPGVGSGSIAGRGIYASELNTIQTAGKYAEGSAKKYGLEYGENAGLVKITLQPGTKILDLTNSATLQKLKEKKITDFDTFYTDPSVAIKFSSGEKNWWIIKTRDPDQVKYSAPTQEDFDKLSPREKERIGTNIGPETAAILSDFIPIKLKVKSKKTVFSPFVTGARKISEKVRSIPRNAKQIYRRASTLTKNKKDELFAK
ncbi:MAG: hypothetical protein AB8C84_04775 [Oligoflexales bacterium]